MVIVQAVLPYWVVTRSLRRVSGALSLAVGFNNGKQGLGLNHPPPAGGGIPGIFPVPRRLGLNDPQAPAGGIWLNIICVDTNGFQPTVRFRRRYAAKIRQRRF